MKGGEKTTPQENLHTALTKIVTVTHSADVKASFQCVYEDSIACWLDPDINKMTPVTPVRRPEEVLTASGMLEKYFKVQWEIMMSDQRGQKDKKGKTWKQMNISGALLLGSIVCDRYL